ncbi:MAG: hypothetical protein AAF578_11060 [Pseudomonadota bacterium]
MKARLIVLGLLLIAAIAVAVGALPIPPEPPAKTRTTTPPVALTKSTTTQPTGAGAARQTRSATTLREQISRPSFVNACASLVKDIDDLRVKLSAVDEADEAGLEEALQNALVETVFGTFDTDPVKLTKLSASDDPEHLLLAAVQIRKQDDPEAQKQADQDLAELSKRIADLGGSNPTFAFTAFQLCSRVTEAERRCDLPRLRDLALDVDGDNSQVWAQIALNLHTAGKTDDALKALRRAATAPSTNDHYVEQYEMLVRAFTALDDPPLNERIIEAVRLALIARSDGEAIRRLCAQQVVDDPRWADPCLGYGQHLQTRSVTQFGKMLGHFLETSVHDALGKSETAEVLRKAWYAEQSKAVDNVNREYLALVRYDPGLFALLLDQMAVYGEAAAHSRVSEALTAFAQHNPELNCIPDVVAFYENL